MTSNNNKLPKISSWEDIMDLPDLFSAVKLMSSWKVITKGVKDIDGAVQRLMGHWKEKTGEPAITKEQEHSGFGVAIQGHRKVRENLTEKFVQARQLYKELPPKIQRSLNDLFPSMEQTFKINEKALERGECVILILGEVGAGKSTIVNILLGIDLLPSNPLKCTNTVCELRSSRSGQKEAMAYYKPTYSTSGDRERKQPPKIISLRNAEGVLEFQRCIQETSNEDSEESPYDRIEIYWPLPMLGQDIVIVDTPGVEGGSNMDKGLKKYLSKAFGFIYVINTNTAGGVQQSRLGHLLNIVVNAADDFSPEASLFIGNKWENVPDRDKPAVQQDTYMKLQKVYPGVTLDQIHYMSAKKAETALMKYGGRTRDHNTLLEKLETLIPNSLRQGIHVHYCWLSEVLKRMMYLLRVSCIADLRGSEELEKEVSILGKQVEILKKNTDKSLGRLKYMVKFEIDKVTTAVKEAIRTKKMLDILCTWDERDCPSPTKKWKNIVDEAAVSIAERVARAIDAWDRENHVLQNIDDEILEVFAKEFGLMEHQIAEVEDALLKNRGGSNQFVHTIKAIPVKPAKKKAKLVEKTYRTLGGAFSSIGTLDPGKKDVKKIFKEYEKSHQKSQKMAEATTVFLNNILVHKEFAEKLQKFFSRFFQDIDEVGMRIPIFLKADQQLLETLKSSIDEKEKYRQKYPGLQETCSKLLGKTDIFFINNIMKFDFDRSDIECQWSDDDILGTGSFADVYKGTLKCSGKDVALKMCKERVKKSNVTDILMEDRTMRDMRHPNVVRYYGATYKWAKDPPKTACRPKNNNTIVWIMVMERCRCSCKEYYTGTAMEPKMTSVPGDFAEGHPTRATAVSNMLQHGRQICEGLAHIHEKGYTHRDMKLENVLISVDKVAKITDVGVAKKTNVLVQTCNGSPAYMAPEVLLGTRNHDSKVDIYSLSLMLWEMWFGRDITKDIDREVLGSGSYDGDAMGALKARQSKGDEGFRPRFSNANKPPQPFIHMLQKSWAYSPDVRPSAADLVAFFRDFTKNNNTPSVTYSRGDKF